MDSFLYEFQRLKRRFLTADSLEGTVSEVDDESVEGRYNGIDFPAPREEEEEEEEDWSRREETDDYGTDDTEQHEIKTQESKQSVIGGYRACA